MKPGTPSLQSTRLLDQVREQFRYKHYSLKTVKAYLYWILFFIRWSAKQYGGMRHPPREMGVADVEAFYPCWPMSARHRPSLTTKRSVLCCFCTGLAFAAIGHRHSHGTRVAGSFRRFDNDDLHPCAQGGSGWHGQPFGFTASGLSRHHNLTGIPRPAICCLACPTVNSP